MSKLNVQGLKVSPFEVTDKNDKLKSIYLENKTYECVVTRLKKGPAITIIRKTDKVLPINYSRRRNQFYVDTDGFSVKDTEQLEAITTWILYSLDAIELLKDKLQEIGILKNT